MQVDRVYLGQFECISGRFAISDPCYTTDVWCRGELENVKKGMWNAEVWKCDAGRCGKRVALLTATHAAFRENAKGDIMETANFEVGVDSGQAGIFDAAHYRDDSVLGDYTKPHYDFEESGDKWYEFCCDKTLAKAQAGVIPYGVVSCSGFGDGDYVCTYCVDSNGETVKVTITFITEDVDEGEDDD